MLRKAEHEILVRRSAALAPFVAMIVTAHDGVHVREERPLRQGVPKRRVVTDPGRLRSRLRRPLPELVLCPNQCLWRKGRTC